MTTENNKIIAEFMGLTIITDSISYFDTTFKPLKKYHSDWSKLMEVIDKIESLGYWVEIIGGYHNQCNIGIQNNTKNLIERDSETKVEAVYNAVVAFIKWYNEQNNK